MPTILVSFGPKWAISKPLWTALGLAGLAGWLAGWLGLAGLSYYNGLGIWGAGGGGNRGVARFGIKQAAGSPGHGLYPPHLRPRQFIGAKHIGQISSQVGDLETTLDRAWLGWLAGLAGWLGLAGLSYYNGLGTQRQGSTKY